MDFMTFVGPTFTMQIPTNWFVASNAQYQAIFTDSQAQDGFQANLMLSIRSVQAGMRIQEVAESAKQTQVKEYPSYQVLEETISETPLASVRRVYRWHHPEQKLDFQQTQFFVIHAQRLYTLTGTRLATGQQGSMADKIFDQMIASFTLQPQ